MATKGVTAVYESRCFLCGGLMQEKKLRGNHFWECLTCGAELWPYDERVEKAIRSAMHFVKSRRKYGRGSRRKRYKTKKPGEKWVPWYRR